MLRTGPEVERFAPCTLTVQAASLVFNMASQNLTFAMGLDGHIAKGQLQEWPPRSCASPPAPACVARRLTRTASHARASRLDGQRPDERKRFPHSPHTRARAALPMLCKTRIPASCSGDLPLPGRLRSATARRLHACSTGTTHTTRALTAASHALMDT